MAKTLPSTSLSPRNLQGGRGGSLIDWREPARNAHVLDWRERAHELGLLAFADTCRRASAAQVCAVIPYFGYARADKRHGRREPITATWSAALLQAVGMLIIKGLRLFLFQEPLRWLENARIDGLAFLDRTHRHSGSTRLSFTAGAVGWMMKISFRREYEVMSHIASGKTSQEPNGI